MLRLLPLPAPMLIVRHHRRKMKLVYICILSLFISCTQTHEKFHEDGSILRYTTVNGKAEGEAGLYYKNGLLHGVINFRNDTVVDARYFDYNQILYHSIDSNKVNYLYMYYRSDTSLYQVMYGKGRELGKIDSVATVIKGPKKIILKAHFIRNNKDSIDIVKTYQNSKLTMIDTLPNGKYWELEKQLMGKDTFDLSYFPITRDSELKKTMPNIP